MGKAPRRGVNDPRSQKPRGPDRSAYLPPLAGAERVIFGGSLAGNVCSSCLSNSSSSSRLSRCSRVSISLVTTNLSYLGGQPSPLTFSATALNAWLGEWISCGKGCNRKTRPLLHCGTRFGGFGPPGASTRCGARPVHERICRYPELRGDCLETRLNIIALMYALKTRSQGSCGLLTHGHTAAIPIQASISSRRQTGRGLWYTGVRQKEMLRLRAR